jgi:Rrf2 family iron-sulfur cluster assembly transcriptional regulator
MLFSKSFGYALRGLLFIAATQKEGRSVQVDEIAGELAVPRFFLAKILKSLVKAGFLESVKGRHGGFAMPSAVLNRQLIELLEATDGLDLFHSCVLRLRACNAKSPCPLHVHFAEVQQHMWQIMNDNTIGSFLGGEKSDLLRSLSIGDPETLRVHRSSF